MPTKPLYTAPAKPRGLESIEIERVKLIKLLKDERTRQAKRASDAKRDHQKRVIDILTQAVKRVREGKVVGESEYSDSWKLRLPKPPVFNPCNYDQVIHRLENDGRELLVLSSGEWNSLFPCDIGGN